MYNKKIKVTPYQYKIFFQQFKGIVAYKEEKGKYFIKPMVGGYDYAIRQVFHM